MEYAAGILGGIGAFVTVQLVELWMSRRSLKITDRAEEMPEENRIVEKYFSVAEKIFYLMVSVLFTWMITVLYRESIRQMLLPLLVYEILLICAMIDSKTRCIYNWMPVAVIVIGICNLVYLLFFQQADFMSACLGSLIGSGIIFVALYIMARVFQAGIGMGDVKLIASLGFVFGLGGVLEIMFVALFICMVAALFLMAFRKKKRKDTLPFAPFILMGYVGLVLINFILVK